MLRLSYSVVDGFEERREDLCLFLRVELLILADELLSLAQLSPEAKSGVYGFVGLSRINNLTNK